MTKGFWNESEPIEVANRPLRRRKTRQLITIVDKNGKAITWNSFFFSPFKSDDEATIEVNPDKTFQKIVGFGGALTGAVSYNADKLPSGLKKALFTAYYSNKSGIGYNMVRVPIGGCDFDLSPWGYNELPEDDPTLSNFTRLDVRDEKMVENLRLIKEIMGSDTLKIKGAAWSPPPWFKSNRDWTGASVLMKKYFQTWADYHLKYLELMDKEGIKFWAISTGNEPMNGVIGFAVVKFMSLGWTPSDQAMWIAKNLGPTLRNSSYSDVKIFVGDDQRFLFPWYFNLMRSSHPKAFEFVDGFGVHFYWDHFVTPNVMDETARLFKDKLIINTESCLGDKPYQVHGPVLGSWDRGVEYFESYMQDLQHSVNGWIDWNLWLDEHGGPNYVNNTVDSPIIVNATSKSEAYKQPMFYAIGHFSKFIQENSVRVETKTDHSFVDVVGFQRSDNTMVLVIQNKHQNKAVRVNIKDSRRSTKTLVLAPDSFHTVLYNV